MTHRSADRRQPTRESAKPTRHSAEPSRTITSVHGQIEQVVSSADCRQVEPSTALLIAFPQHSRPKAGGATGILDRQSAEPSVDDRLAVAFAARGFLRIGQLLVKAFGEPDHGSGPCLFYMSDEDVVAALEAEVGA